MATALPIEEHITCSVCLEIYKDPHALKCLHTYCLPCIKQLQRGNTVACPDCREVTRMSDIKKEFKIHSLVNFHHRSTTDVSGTKQQQCDVCSLNKQLQAKCIDCDQFMCDDCHRAHKGMNVSKGHKVIIVSDMVKSLQAKFTDKQNEMDDMQKSIDRKCQDIAQAIRNLEVSREKQVRELKQIKEKMIDQIESHYHEIIQITNTAHEQLLQSLNSNKQLCEHMKQNMKSTQDFMFDMAQSDDVTALTETLHSLDGNIRAQIEEITSKLSTLTVPKESNLMVKKGREFNPNDYFNIVTLQQDFSITRTHLCKVDYTELANKTISIVKTVDIAGNHHAHRVQMIDDNIWCAVHSDGINIYSQEGNLIKKITHKKLKKCLGVAQTHKGDIVVSCGLDCNLHQLSSAGSYMGCIAEGAFSDVCVFGGRLFTLDYTNCRIMLFEHSQDKWICVKTISLQHGNGHPWDKIGVSAVGMYISSYETKCLYVHNLDGTFLYKTGEDDVLKIEAGRFGLPLLSSVDISGNALVCDTFKGILQVYNQDKKKWTVLTLPEELGNLVDAVVDPDSKCMWIVTKEKELIKLSLK